ncbi:hypothetical protein O59_003875 [Cellvibrio sp. BR]|nr:hypothetical protein O59_003875 [Cellvibrio sp. BR]
MGILLQADKTGSNNKQNNIRTEWLIIIQLAFERQLIAK